MNLQIESMILNGRCSLKIILSMVHILFHSLRSSHDERCFLSVACFKQARSWSETFIICLIFVLLSYTSCSTFETRIVAEWCFRKKKSQFNHAVIDRINREYLIRRGSPPLNGRKVTQRGSDCRSRIRRFSFHKAARHGAVNRPSDSLSRSLLIKMISVRSRWIILSS